MTNLINFLDNNYITSKEQLLMDCEDFLLDNGKFLSRDDIEELKTRGVNMLDSRGRLRRSAPSRRRS